MALLLEVDHHHRSIILGLFMFEHFLWRHLNDCRIHGEYFFLKVISNGRYFSIS